MTPDPPDTPIHLRALHGLVADLNAIGATYPGTDVPVRYRVRRPRRLSDVHQFQAVAYASMSRGLSHSACRHGDEPSS
jgi:hypothetical protein